MINHQNTDITQSLEQLALYHFALAEHFKLLKEASGYNPALYYQYAELHFYNKALENGHKAILAAGMKPSTTAVGPTDNKTLGMPNNPSLLNSLREGGYILYARHGEATVGEDQSNLNFQYCSTQRNLSEGGRKQAATYGETLRRLRIPVKYPVLVSPFCRTIETAELAFGEENVQVDPFWIEIYNLNANLNTVEQKRILNSLNSALETQPPLGSNMVIFAHSFPKEVGLGQIPDMGTIVVKPRGQGKGYEIIGQVSLTELTSLLE